MRAKSAQPDTIMLPNDHTAKEFFAGARWNWNNLPDYRDGQQRLEQYRSEDKIVLETGNENEGSYALVCIARSPDGREVLLTNYTSQIVETEGVREHALPMGEFTRVLSILPAEPPSMPSIAGEDYYVDDGTAFYLTWVKAGCEYRVSLFEVFVASEGEDLTETGVERVDAFVRSLSGAIRALYALVEGSEQ